MLWKSVKESPEPAKPADATQDRGMSGGCPKPSFELSNNTEDITNHPERSGNSPTITLHQVAMSVDVGDANQYLTVTDSGGSPSDIDPANPRIALRNPALSDGNPTKLSLEPSVNAGATAKNPTGYSPTMDLPLLSWSAEAIDATRCSTYSDEGPLTDSAEPSADPVDATQNPAFLSDIPTKSSPDLSSSKELATTSPTDSGGSPTTSPAELSLNTEDARENTIWSGDSPTIRDLSERSADASDATQSPTCSGDSTNGPVTQGDNPTIDSPAPGLQTNSHPHPPHLFASGLEDNLFGSGRTEASLGDTIWHDNQVHHPLGTGSYYFQENLFRHLLRNTNPEKDIIIKVGAQPNGSPHLGTITTFALAFLVARKLQHDINDPQEVKPVSSMPSSGSISLPGLPRKVFVSLELVDTAPCEQKTDKGIRYQRSQRDAADSKMHHHLKDFKEVLGLLSNKSGIEYRVRNQREFLLHPGIPRILMGLVKNREKISSFFSSDKGPLGIRAACPEPGCNWAEKGGDRNRYLPDCISFECLEHGRFEVDITTSDGVAKLEFNTPIRNLLRTIHYAEDDKADWIQVTGGDYAGQYQESFLRNPLAFWQDLGNQPIYPTIVYAPLIVDWSGGKLSKTLYVKQGAYNYLRAQNLDYFVSYEILKAKGMSLDWLIDEVQDWVNEPKKIIPELQH